MRKIVEQIRAELVAAADEKTRMSGETFFKEDIKIHGVKSSESRRISKSYQRALKGVAKRDIFDYVMSKRLVMPRTALRYAIEKMPKELKTKAMER